MVCCSTDDTVVTGPPNSLLVIDWKKPGFVEVVVHVEAGCVIVTGTTVVTTPAEVLGVPPDVIVWAMETTAVDGLTIV